MATFSGSDIAARRVRSSASSRRPSPLATRAAPRIDGPVAWLELQRATCRDVRSDPVPIVRPADECQRRVSLTQIRIELQGVLHGLSCFLVSLGYRRVTLRRVAAVGQCQPGPCGCIVRIQRHRLLEILKRLLQALFGVQLAEVSPLQVRVVSGGLRAPHGALLLLATEERHSQRVRHRPRDISLDGKDVVHLPVVGF